MTRRLHSTLRNNWLQHGVSAVLFCAVALLHSPHASARNLEPGRLFLGAGLGAAARLPTLLGSSPAAGQLVLGGEYTLHRSTSVVADLSLGMGHTNTLVGAAGLRGRLTDMGLTLSPFVQLELAAGSLFNVLGANVPLLGSRLGVGVDYFLTGQSTASLQVVALLGGTLRDRHAFYGTVQVLLAVQFGAAGPARPVPQPLPVLGA